MQIFWERGERRREQNRRDTCEPFYLPPFSKVPSPTLLANFKKANHLLTHSFVIFCASFALFCRARSVSGEEVQQAQCLPFCCLFPRQENYKCCCQIDFLVHPHDDERCLFGQERGGCPLNGEMQKLSPPLPKSHLIQIGAEP